jgi:hypothetical protein
LIGGTSTEPDQVGSEIRELVQHVEEVGRILEKIEADDPLAVYLKVLFSKLETL